MFRAKGRNATERKHHLTLQNWSRLSGPDGQRFVLQVFLYAFSMPAFVATAVAQGPPPQLALQPVVLRLLVLTGNGTEPSFLAIQSFLNQIGIPHDDVILAPPGSGAVALPALNDATKGFYQGIILATGNLGVCNAGGVCGSALPDAGWMALDTYTATFGIRTLSYYTFPNARFGLSYTSALNTTTVATNATFTPAANTLFPYLNQSHPLQVSGAYVYLATPVSATGEVTTPLLSLNGATIAALHKKPDGREYLALTFDDNPNLLHSLALNYGLINWVTKGVFLGERHIYLTPQVDDLFIANELYSTAPGCKPTGFLIDPTSDLAASCPTDQVSGMDLTALAQWQDKLHASAQTAGFTTTLAFNGVGADDGNGGVDQTDDLVSAAMLHAGSFFWVSHTYDHMNLDCYNSVINSGVCTLADAAQSASEIDSNVQIGKLLRVKLDQQSMVTPEISGLNNPNFIQTAVQRGIKYLIIDSSTLIANPLPPNTGLLNSISNSILMIPRRPTSIFYNVASQYPGDIGSLPDEYNYFYGPQGLYRVGGAGGTPFYTSNQTYAQILSHESDSLLMDMLRYKADPIMFHQSNLVRYDDINSLYMDLITQTLSKFSNLSNLPVISLSQADIGLLYQQRMEYNASGVQAIWRPGSPATVTLTAMRTATVPITGFCQSACESYGGQTIAHVPVPAGQTVTVQGLISTSQ